MREQLKDTKLEALERDMEKLWAWHTKLLPKLWNFQKQHFARRQRSQTYGTKSKNVGQRSPKHTWTMQKTTATAVTVTPIRPTDGEQEGDNRALTQLSRAGIVANVLLPSFGAISLVKAQLKEMTLN
jgi:hypothetical protein